MCYDQMVVRVVRGDQVWQTPLKMTTLVVATCLRLVCVFAMLRRRRMSWLMYMITELREVICGVWHTGCQVSLSIQCATALCATIDQGWSLATLIDKTPLTATHRPSMSSHNTAWFELGMEVEFGEMLNAWLSDTCIVIHCTSIES